jgi:hypothetical protein
MALKRSHLHKRIAALVIGVSCVCLVGCASVGQAEYDEFQPMPANARVMNQVKLSWEVRTDVGAYCLASQKNRGKLQAVEPIACAIWSAASNECRVITGPNPNHVVLGHEVRHCFEGHFHP